MKKAGSLKDSFRYAFKGVGYCLRHERNFRIHCSVGSLAFLLGLVFDLSGAELCVLLLLIAFVLFAEMANTALENLVDWRFSDGGDGVPAERGRPAQFLGNGGNGSGSG